MVGAGIAGSCTALYLRRAGAHVTLVETHDVGHMRAASGGEHRLLRSSHGSDELYTRWSRRARVLWQELGEQVGERLFLQCGVMLLASRGDSTWEDASTATLARLGIPHVVVPLDDIPARFPTVNPDGLAYALWETESGAVYAQRCCIRAVDQFQKEGGRFRRARVTTDEKERPLLDGEPIRADRVVMACGAWMPSLFRRTLGRMLVNYRQDLLFLATPDADERWLSSQHPGFIDHHLGAYGVAADAGVGFKIGLNLREQPIDVEHEDRVPDLTILARMRRYAAFRFPDLARMPALEMRVCQITSTPDTHFLVDAHPDHDDVFFVCGGSGHLAKHGPALGEYATQVILGERETDTRFRYADRTAVSLADRPQ